MSGAALAVFVIGLRHGADPDHLAAIDNLTRNASDRMPRACRFVGSLFAVGHSGMVLASAAVAAMLGSALGPSSSVLAAAGRIAGIAVLLFMVALNVAMLVRGNTATIRTRLLPRVLREATHPLVAIPIGALFGLGFETSSQLLAYGTAFSSAQIAEGVAIGMGFCLGMICTDTVDSLLVTRVVRTGSAPSQRVRRPWIAVVTLVALTVAVQQIVEFSGGSFPVDELTLSAITVCALLVTAAAMIVRSRIRSASERAA
jgi:nickel/cobalt transporter (NiCoT) family protein